MYRLIRILFFVFLVVVVVGFATRNYWLKWSLPYWVHYQTGLHVAAESVDFSEFYPPKLLAYQVEVRNPAGFALENALAADKVEILLPEELWWGGADRARRVVLELDELVVTLNAAGEINLRELPILAPAAPTAGSPPPLLIEELELSLEKVILHDETDPGSAPKVYRLDAVGIKASNVRDRGELEAIILEEALERMPPELFPPGLRPEIRREEMRLIEW
ncbi:MAG: hypothetical protein AAGK14_07165 [Verrucomicrobiota bacterium]